MSYQVLARKWRPRKFSEVVGQQHIVRTLTNSISANKIAHAYLLTGTRGIGKTTIARIFAKGIRCENLSPEGEPCLTCSSCLDINAGNSLDYIEIDGASNNSVDDIRDLIENVQYLPTRGKYKVYVIDEVHMLSVSAFNALLKTLEEPPAHVVFIFATTDPQKLLGTVLSRCQRFDFKNATIADLEKQLKYVANEEDIKFESENLISQVAYHAKGSFRDALSLLDQIINLSSGGVITESDLYSSLGMAETKYLNKLIQALLLKDRASVLSVYKEVLSQNIDLKIFVKQILDKVYDLITHINDKGELQSSDLASEVLAEVSLVELMWLYEALSKDFEWALKSLDPEKACGFVLAKSALRELVLKGIETKVQLKKNSEIKSKPEGKNQDVIPGNREEVAEAVVEEPIETVEVENIVHDLSWDSFMNQLSKSSKSLMVNLERGNLLNKEDFGKAGKELVLKFSEECKIFYDYLMEPEHYRFLRDEVAKFARLEFEESSLIRDIVSNFFKSFVVRKIIRSLTKVTHGI